MEGKGNLMIDFLDVYGDRPDDQVDVTLKHTGLNQTLRLKNLSTTKRLRIADLETGPGALFNLQIFPMRHRSVSRFVRLLEGKTVQQSVVLPMAADRVASVEFPTFQTLNPDLQEVLRESTVEGIEERQGAALYEALDDLRKAAMLNIYARMKAITFANGRDTFSYITSLTQIRSDRFLAKATQQLRDEVKNSTHTQLFRMAPDLLHTPPAGFQHAGVFQTPELYASLQLALFRDPRTDEFICDIDIDDAGGIDHIFQVLRRSGGSSNPFEIHEILLEFLKIDPGYRLIA